MLCGVGCTYSSIHFFVSKSRSIIDSARVQAFTLLLTKTLSRSRSVVWCVVWCVHVVLCVCVGCVCVVFCCGGACVWCVVKLGTLSLSLALLLSLLPLLFPFPFPFLFLSYLYFSLFFFFFFFSCSFSYSCYYFVLQFYVNSEKSTLGEITVLFSPPNTMERTDQPTRRPTSRHLNVIWRRASAQQSVLSLLLSPPSSLLLSFQRTKKKKEGTFHYRNISGEEFIFITV